ncbi:MAG: PepSY-associated TM helix domain-containing protein [Candidatus Electrothrix scaldis]|nr:MAG: PepSY-associated TM helix domain-containing protein [Candidatus Electrothrix sp. GW3-3]
MNKRSWRLVHRWAGLFLLGFVLFYCLTGLLLNHRKSFGYFQNRQTTSATIEVQSEDVLNDVVEKYKQLIGRDDDPTVIRLKPEGVIEFLYGSHGRTTYVIDTMQGLMTRIGKEEQQPWYWLNNLHKSSKVSSAWLVLTDCIAVLIIILALSGLVIFRYTRLDILLLACGGLVMLGGMLLS